jgi:ADP-ribosylglycohydrolase
MDPNTLETIIDSLNGTVFNKTFSSGNNPSVLLIGTHDHFNIQWYTLDIEAILEKLEETVDTVLFEGYSGDVTPNNVIFTPAADLFSTSNMNFYFNDDIRLLKLHSNLINSNSSEDKKEETVKNRNNSMVYGPHGITNHKGFTAQIVGMRHLTGLMEELEKNNISYIATVASKIPSKDEFLDFIKTMSLAQSSDKYDRRYSAEKLSNFPLVLARKKLQELVYDSSALVTREAVKSLRMLGDSPTTIDTFVSLLTHPDEETRWLASAALHDIDKNKKPKLHLPRRIGFALPYYYAGVSEVTEDNLEKGGHNYDLFINNVLGNTPKLESTFPITKKCSLDKILGSLYGLVIGDARGAPIENLDIEFIDKCIGRISDYSRHGIREPGDFTDDWEMSWAIVKSILEKKSIDISDIATKFSLNIEQNDRDGLDRGYGMMTKMELRKYLSGMPLSSIGSNSNGAGALMRVAPLVACSDDIKNSVFEVSRITHNNYEACCTAYATAYAIKLAYETSNIDPDSFLNEMHNEIAPLHSELGDRIYRLKKVIGMNPNEAFAVIGQGNDHSKWGKGALNVFELSLYSFLHSPADFERTIQTAIYNSGDSDTIGAVAGSMSGAYNGINSIPKNLISGLYKRERYSEDILRFGELVSANK